MLDLAERRYQRREAIRECSVGASRVQDSLETKARFSSVWASATRLGISKAWTVEGEVAIHRISLALQTWRNQRSSLARPCNNGDVRAKPLSH